MQKLSKIRLIMFWCVTPQQMRRIFTYTVTGYIENPIEERLKQKLRNMYLLDTKQKINVILSMAYCYAESIVSGFKNWMQTKISSMSKMGF